MIILRTGMVPTGKWYCSRCATANDPESDRCWECNADTDGNVEIEEGDFDDAI